MTSHFKNLDHIQDLSVPAFTKNNSTAWVVFMFVMILPFLSLMFYLVAHKLVSNRYAEIDRELLQETNISLIEHSQSFQHIFDEIELLSYRIRRSPQIQKAIQNENNRNLLEAAETDAFIQEALSIFARQNNFKGAWLINRRLSNFAHSRNVEPLPESAQKIAHRVFLERKTQHGSVMLDGNDLMIDLYMPITKSEQDRHTESVRQIGVLAIRLSLTAYIEEIFKPLMERPAKTNVYFFQEGTEEDGAAMIVLANANKPTMIFNRKNVDENRYLKKMWRFFERGDTGKYNVSQRPYKRKKGGRYLKGDKLFSQTNPSHNLPFRMMAVVSLHDAYRTQAEYVKQVHTIAQLIAIVIFISAFSVWWWYQSLRQETLSRNYHTFAKTLNAQKNLFVNINTAIAEQVSLKDLQGRYLYANPAFIKFCNKDVKSVLSKTDADVWGDSVLAEKLPELDKKVIETRKEVVENITTKDVRGKDRIVEFQKTPFLDISREMTGIVTIARDVTAEEMEKEARDKSFHNITKLLMALLKEHDPYLLKHTDYLVHIVQQMAKYLKYKTGDSLALEYAARLSQVGKIFVDPKILKTPDVERTPEMIEVYQDHIFKSALMLDAMDWTVPVMDGISTMYERLDGSGYPNAIKGDEIGRLPRVLAVCDEFCKKTMPRRGEKISTPEEALKELSLQNKQLDITFVQALAEMISEQPEVLMMR